jgi:hypothetical protein
MIKKKWAKVAVFLICIIICFFSLFSDALKFSVIFTEIQVLDKFRYEDQFDHLGKYTADCSTNNCCLAIYK